MENFSETCVMVNGEDIVPVNDQTIPLMAQRILKIVILRTKEKKNNQVLIKKATHKSDINPSDLMRQS